MTAVKHFEADRYIASLPKDVCVFLVFGSDTGLITERVSNIIAKSVDDCHDPFQTINMHGDDIADNAGHLIDEARTIGLFRTAKAIHVTAGRKTFAGAIKMLLETPPTDCKIVISAGPLRGDTPLRSVCSRSEFAAAIECYPDNERDIARIVDEEFAKSGIGLSDDARMALLSCLGADRLLTRAELQKLILYAHGRKEVSESDIREVITGASAEMFDDAIDAAFLGDHKRATTIVSRVFERGENVNGLINGCIRRCLLLHRMTIYKESGGSIDRIMEQHGQMRLPPARRRKIEEQIRVHSSDRILDLLGRLNQYALQVREDAGIADLLAARMLWVVSRAKRSTPAHH